MKEHMKYVTIWNRSPTIFSTNPCLAPRINIRLEVSILSFINYRSKEMTQIRVYTILLSGFPMGRLWNNHICRKKWPYLAAMCCFAQTFFSSVFCASIFGLACICIYVFVYVCVYVCLCICICICVNKYELFEWTFCLCLLWDLDCCVQRE